MIITPTISDFYTWEDLQHEYDAIEWLWQSWLPKGVVTMIAADPGVGKSMLALTICKIGLQGGSWLDGVHDFLPDESGFALWVECESGEPFHIMRSKRLGLDMSKIATMRLLTEPNSTPALSNAKDRDRVRTMLANDAVKFAVIDSLSGAVAGVDENSSEAGKIVQWLSEVARDTNKPVILVHHMNKTAMRTRGGDSTPTQADLRGSTAIPQHCRVIWAMDIPNGDESQPRLSQIKNNLAPKPHPIQLLIHPDGYMLGRGSVQKPISGLRSEQYRDDWSG